jgi:hypothetical protein
MKYLFLAYREERPPDDLSGTERAAQEACSASDAALRQAGHLLAAETCQGGSSAATVRVRSGHVAVAEGPYARTKEQLSGLYLIDAADLNEAIRVASRMPQALLGPIEVRLLSETPGPVGPAVDGGQRTLDAPLAAEPAVATAAW